MHLATADPQPAHHSLPFLSCSFFRNVDTRVEPHRTLPVGDGSGPIRTLKVGMGCHKFDPGGDRIFTTLNRSAKKQYHTARRRNVARVSQSTWRSAWVLKLTHFWFRGCAAESASNERQSSCCVLQLTMPHGYAFVHFIGVLPGELLLPVVSSQESSLPCEHVRRWVMAMSDQDPALSQC